MLTDEIIKAQRSVKTDAYQMSIGEIVNMYANGEIIIDPEFQRLFRWKIGQKSKLIESILLGIPLPSIFVFEKENGSWELIDGLQRVSTILEFMGKLRGSNGELETPSILEATKYLPSLHNAVWERSTLIPDIMADEQKEIEKSHQLAIRRARIGVEILKRPSDDLAKFDLFQRLNAGGTQANAQELRNCIMLRVNEEYYRAVKRAAEQVNFQSVVGVTDDQIEKQRHMELAVRFLVHTHVVYDGILDVEAAEDLINRTFSLLNSVAGRDTLRRADNEHPVGKIGLVGIEAIAVGVAKNLNTISALQNPVDFVRDKIRTFWSQHAVSSFTSLGLRGTTRIQRTVPFGDAWFRP